MSEAASGSLTRRLGAVDAMWLEMDRPGNLMVIAAVVLLESRPDWSEVRRLVRDRVVARYPVFRQRPVRSRMPLGRPSWTDDSQFDLAHHVTRATLPRPGDDRALQTYIDEHLSRPFDQAHPLWELHLVDGYGSGAALVCRLHHSLADGLALARVLMSLTEDVDGEADEDPLLDVPPPLDQGRAPLVSLTTAGLDLVRLPLRLAWRGAGALREPRDLLGLADTAWRTAQVAGTLLFSANPSSPVAGEPGPRKRVVWSAPLPLKGLESLRRLSGATVNDVLMSAAAAALYAYQVEHRAEPVDLMTMVPVNVRPPDQPLPRELGNEFALVLLRLPSGLGTPLGRLAETKRRMDWIKGTPEPVLTYGITKVIGVLGRGLGRVLVDFFADKAIGVTTNVRGPDAPRYLAGTRITGVLGWVPGSGRQTLGICIFTYAGSVRVGFMSDAAVIPDPELLLAAYEDELDRLVRMGGPRRGDPDPSPRPVRAKMGT